MKVPCAVLVLGATQSFRPLAELFLARFSEEAAASRPCELALVLFENVSTAELSKLVDERRPVLSVHAANGFVILGPLQVAGHSVCLDCYQYWMATAEAAMEEAAAPPRNEDMILAAGLGAKLVAAYPDPAAFSDLLQGLVSVNTDTLVFTTHSLFRRRDCKYCGELVNPTPQALRAHCSSLVGIVRKMDITAEPIAGVYVGLASFVSPLAVGDARPRLRERLCTGRGLSAQQAEESCIGEAVERFSLVFRGDEPMVRGRLDEVGGVHPNEIMRISERQFEDREEWNRSADERFTVPERFDPSRPIDWIRAEDLVSGETVLVPAACCLMWYRSRHGDVPFGLADTIGCASWSNWQGALANALLEMVERDALAIWWYNRLQRPAISVESLEHPPLMEIQKGLAGLGRNLVLLDVTTDLGIPTYVSIAALADGSEPLFSSASDFSPRSAATRAASEILQFWFAATHHKTIDLEIHKWLSTATLASQSYLCPAGTTEAIGEPPIWANEQRLQGCIEAMTKCGLRPIGLDQSRADVALKTARAIVPGMRHIWNRRAAGRLFDVPVQLGWRATPLAEEDLNSICCMI